MTITTQPMTLADYLAYDNGTDSHYELVNGELVQMPPESRLNDQIASFLFACFLQQGIPYYRLTMKTEVMVTRTQATVRRPDLLVLSEDLVQALTGATRSTVTLEMPPPGLVVEVVSPGQQNEARDYHHKRLEYGARGIKEYWVIDPHQLVVTVFERANGSYIPQEFRGEARVVSPMFPQWEWSASQILGPGV